MGNKNINTEEELLMLFFKCWLNFYSFQYRIIVQHLYAPLFLKCGTQQILSSMSFVVFRLTSMLSGI